MTWLMQNPVTGSGVVTLVALLIAAFIVWLILMAMPLERIFRRKK